MQAHAIHEAAVAIPAAGAELILRSRNACNQAEALFRDMGMDWWTERAEGLRGRIDSGAEFVWFAPYVDGPPVVT